MVSVFSPVKEMTAEEYRRVTEVTYLGYVHGTLAALKRMLPRDRGVIVQVGSALAYRGIPLQAAYCGAKHAIQGFTESLRCELLHERVQRERHHGAAAGAQHAAVRLGQEPFADKPQPVPPIYQPEVAAAPSSGPQNMIGAKSSWGCRRCWPSWVTRLRRESWTATWLALALRGSERTRRLTQADQTICGNRLMRTWILAPTAISTPLLVHRAGNGGSQRIGITFY